MKLHIIRFALAVFLLAAALPVTAAPTGTWTAVASTGVVDESAVGIYSFGSTNLTYLPGSPSVAQVVARYNVTKTYAPSDTPPWTLLELGYNNPSSISSVQATLYQVDRCTGVQKNLCTVTSGVGATCGSCTFSPTINFATNLYYVQVTLSRSAPSVSPQALTLRIR